MIMITIDVSDAMLYLRGVDSEKAEFYLSAGLKMTMVAPQLPENSLPR